VADHERRLGDAHARPVSVTTRPALGAGRASSTRRWTLPRRGDNALVRAIGRAPVRVRTKLLVAFAAIAVVLVAVAALGLRVLGQSNSRVEALGTLQLRAATYQGLQTQSQQLRQLLALRGAQDPNLDVYIRGNAASVRRGGGWALVDQAIATALSQLGPATNESRFGFVPPPADEALLRRIRADYQSFSRTLERIIVLDRTRAPTRTIRSLLATVIDTDNDLGALTDRLAAATFAQTDALIAQNRHSYSSSRNLFVGVGAGSIVLALLLGLALSGSVVGPIQRTEARLAEIAVGDFTVHVDVPNRDELGSLAANLNRMNDELRRLYEELETVSRHKSEFLANMSHELRTPLNAIIGFSELLHQESFGPLNEHQRVYVEDVLGAGQHLLSLINDILDLAKVEAGRIDLELTEVSLRETLASGLTMHAGRAAREGIEIALRLDPEEIRVRADERRLRQIVFNLLSNAVKFTPAGGRVEVSALALDGVVEVAVADTGPGIAPDDQEIVFQEFGQARSGPERDEEGTGLGLPLSRRFVELHGGRLWVESAPGQGSTFRFTLPAASSRRSP
jgi:signal transduction histidine kinase